MLNYLKYQLVNLRLSETIRTSIIALNMVQLTTEQRTFLIKTFYETNTLQQARVAFGLINFA
jgi:ribosome recycling factor